MNWKPTTPLFYQKLLVTYEEDDLPTHYSFQYSFGVLEMIRYYEKVSSNGREYFLAGQSLGSYLTKNVPAA